MPSSAELDTLFEVLKSVVMHSAFPSVVAKIEGLVKNEKSSLKERVQEAFRQLTPQALNAEGIPMDEKVTFTTLAVDSSTAFFPDNEDPAVTGQKTVLGFDIPFTNPPITFWMRFYSR